MLSIRGKAAYVTQRTDGRPIFTYSRVPNKRTGHLLENEKKSSLYELIWDYSFIDFQQKVPPIRLFPPILLFIFELSIFFNVYFVVYSLDQAKVLIHSLKVGVF